MYRKILIEPAKTARGTCKNCKGVIEKDTLRLQVVDDRAFREALRIHGGGGEGEYRGYVETSTGSISIEKYFVHLECYRPVRPHPMVKEYFNVTKLTKPGHKEVFNAWLEASNASPPAALANPRSQKTKIKRSNQQDDGGDWRSKPAKTKKIKK